VPVPVVRVLALRWMVVVVVVGVVQSVALLPTVLRMTLSLLQRRNGRNLTQVPLPTLTLTLTTTLTLTPTTKPLLRRRSVRILKRHRQVDRRQHSLPLHVHCCTEWNILVTLAIHPQLMRV
jgi:hypothetical protein